MDLQQQRLVDQSGRLVFLTQHTVPSGPSTPSVPSESERGERREEREGGKTSDRRFLRSNSRMCAWRLEAECAKQLKVAKSVAKRVLWTVRVKKPAAPTMSEPRADRGRTGIAQGRSSFLLRNLLTAA